MIAVRLPQRVASTLYWQEQRLRGRGGVRERLNWLRANQERSAEEIADLQFAKLRDVVAHAYRTVPYYREAMDERGVRELTRPEDLRKLPVLTRDILIRRQQDLYSSEADRATVVTNFSSGSTGRRAEFAQDLDFRLWMRAHQLRTYEWCAGWQVGDPFALLWGSEIYWSFKQWVDRLENLITNRREVNTFRLSPELVRAVLTKLVALRPVLVSTYSNAIHLIAREAQRQSIAIPSLRAIQATSEPMPPPLRQRVADVFGCEVYDKYGMRETNIIAHEAPGHGPLLIQAENVFVEIVDETGAPCPPGTTGRIVVTTLNNRSMPLIRYQTSDLSTFVDPQDGGLPYPAMAPVAGREQDLIQTPGGTHVDAYLFSYLMMRFPEVHWFQVVQRELSRLHVRLYVPDGLGKDTASAIIERIHHHTGYAFAVDFEPLAEMPESPTGKFRLCVSELDTPTTVPGEQP